MKIKYFVVEPVGYRPGFEREISDQFEVAIACLMAFSRLTDFEWVLKAVTENANYLFTLSSADINDD